VVDFRVGCAGGYGRLQVREKERMASRCWQKSTHLCFYVQILYHAISSITGSSSETSTKNLKLQEGLITTVFPEFMTIIGHSKIEKNMLKRLGFAMCESPMAKSSHQWHQWQQKHHVHHLIIP